MSRATEIFWKSSLKGTLNYYLSLNVINVLVKRILPSIPVMSKQ